MAQYWPTLFERRPFWPAAAILRRLHRYLAVAPSETVPVAEHQSGAIPYDVVDGRTVVLLVTSRRTGRWIFPKGGIAGGLTPAESAAKEAFEEAGVKGVVDDAPIGSYRSWKIRGLRRRALQIDMYPLRVTSQLDDWREKGQRYRHWATLQEACRLLDERRLQEIVKLLDKKARPEAKAEPQAELSRSATGS